MKESSFWWYGVAFGRTGLTKTPSGKNIVKDSNTPISFIFSYTVPIIDIDYDYGLSYELKISKVFLLFPDDHLKELLKHEERGGITSFSQLQQIISNTITFLMFYSVIHELISVIRVLRPNSNNQFVLERTHILNNIFAMIKSDKELKTLFREYLGIIDSMIKSNKAISYLFHNTS